MHHPGVHHRIHRARGGTPNEEQPGEGRQEGTDRWLGASGFPSARAWVRSAFADSTASVWRTGRTDGRSGGWTEDQEDRQGTGRTDGQGLGGRTEGREDGRRAGRTDGDREDRRRAETDRPGSKGTDGGPGGGQAGDQGNRQGAGSIWFPFSQSLGETSVC